MPGILEVGGLELIAHPVSASYPIYFLRLIKVFLISPQPCVVYFFFALDSSELYSVCMYLSTYFTLTYSIIVHT